MTRRFGVVVLAGQLGMGLALLPGVPAAHAVGEEDLFVAARAGDLGAVQDALDGGASVDARTRYEQTPIYLAAERGHLALVRFLAGRDADLDVRDSFRQRTAAEAALANGHLEVAILLVRLGARDSTHRLLVEAARRGSVELVRALVERGPIYGFEQREARALARQAGSEEIVEILEAAKVRHELAAVPLELGVLRRYSGTYRRSGAGQAIEIVVVDEGLELRRETEREVPLTPLSSLYFRSSEHDLGVLFLLRLGAVEGLSLQEGAATSSWVLDPSGDAETEISTSAPAASHPEKVAAPRERAPAAPWPSFRGPGSSGIADDQGLVLRWDVKSEENVLWIREVPGLANSSPVVWGERVFVVTAIPSPDAAGPAEVERAGRDLAEHTWQVITVERSTGDVLWRRTAGRSLPLTGHHLESSQANATPATDGRRLVVVFPTLGLFCYTIGGELLWHQDLGPLNAAFFFDPTAHYGFASSPVLYDGRVILQVDVHEGAYVAAWDLESGHEVWRVERDPIVSWSTPTIYRGEPGDELIVNGSPIFGYDPSDGRELWRLGPNSEMAIATPVVSGGLIYVSSGFAPVRPIYAVRPGSRGDLTLRDGASSSAAIAWSYDRGGTFMPTPLVYRGMLYLVHHNGRLETFDAITGERIYRARLSRGGSIASSPVASDGRFFVSTDDGLVYVIEAGPVYRELAVNEMGESVMSTPAISGGSMIFRTRNRLIAIGRPQAVE